VYAGICIQTLNYEIATDSNAKGKIPVENLFLSTNYVPYEVITLEGREFSETIYNSMAPYYHVSKYTVPEGKGGHYTIDAKNHDGGLGSYTFYICNSSDK